jgi:hypothetical protein
MPNLFLVPALQSALQVAQFKTFTNLPGLHLQMLVLQLSNLVLHHLHFGNLAIDYIATSC